MKRRVVLLVLGALAVAGGAFYWARSNRARGLVLTGIVTTDEVNVSSEIQGRLGQLMVKEGDPVRRNQLLAMIEPQELKADQAYYAHTEEGQTAAVHEAGSALKYQELQTRDQIRQAEAASTPRKKTAPSRSIPDGKRTLIRSPRRTRSM